MRKALSFSGGKDSLACIFLLQDELKEIDVIFVNTGFCFPEQLEIVEMVKKMAPNFIEIHTDKNAQNKEHGMPSDVVPVFFTKIGQEVSGRKNISIQSTLQCCYENIAEPMHKYLKENGYTHVIRGQRNDESHKASSRNGDVIDGIIYIHPIENWTETQVKEYLSKQIELPEHFEFKHTSLDCFDCTGFHADTKDIKSWMAEKHPEKYAIWASKKMAIDNAILGALNG